jgi:hypothetical protein
MNNSEIFSAVVSLVLPYLVEIIKTELPETKGRWLGYLLSYGLCIIVGGGSAYFTGKFDTENILSSAGSALIVSQGFYNLYFKPKKVDQRIQEALK